MKTQLYAIYDTAAGIYTRQVFAQADGVITREFSDLVTNAESPYGQHPEDYSIFRLGVFDDQTGKITDEKNECLGTGLELVALSRNVNRDAQEELELKIASPGGTA